MLGSLTSHTTGMPLVDASSDFQRARRAQLTARAGRWLGRRRRGQNIPLTLADSAAVPGGATRLEVIPLDAIVGTVEPTVHFDARFRPASELVRKRWERVALAYRRGVALPPIAVLQRPDGYYVVDGRHRVSVALALGHRDIEARVTRAGAPQARQRLDCPDGSGVRSAEAVPSVSAVVATEHLRVSRSTCPEGEQDGNRNREVVQRREGLRIHHAR
jgi:hypothetical protein